MNDYISRQAVIQLALDGKITSTDIEKRVRDFINELPAADVQPVKRGEWEESENELNKFCSCCKKVCGTIYDTENYCPNCGADMRGGKPNE